MATIEGGDVWSDSIGVTGSEAFALGTELRQKLTCAGLEGGGLKEKKWSTPSSESRISLHFPNYAPGNNEAP